MNVYREGLIVIVSTIDRYLQMLTILYSKLKIFNNISKTDRRARSRRDWAIMPNPFSAKGEIEEYKKL